MLYFQSWWLLLFFCELESSSECSASPLFLLLFQQNELPVFLNDKVCAVFMSHISDGFLAVNNYLLNGWNVWKHWSKTALDWIRSSKQYAQEMGAISFFCFPSRDLWSPCPVFNFWGSENLCCCFYIFSYGIYIFRAPVEVWFLFVLFWNVAVSIASFWYLREHCVNAEIDLQEDLVGVVSAIQGWKWIESIWKETLSYILSWALTHHWEESGSLVSAPCPPYPLLQMHIYKISSNLLKAE